MHRFIEYISDLLFLHDCVIIPDFGGFICNYKSAYIDENSGRICPPTKDILFNRNLTHNDGLLVNWIADKENISFKNATAQVMLFCEDLKIRLNQKQRIAFGDIGTFYTDRRFNIIFEAGKNNFFAETFGMEAIELPPPVFQEKHRHLETGTPIITPGIPTYVKTSAPGNILYRLMKYALAAGVVAGVVTISQLDFFHFDSDSTEKITNESAVQSLHISNQEHSGKITCNNVISPEHDYVDYDPVSDLNW